MEAHDFDQIMCLTYELHEIKTENIHLTKELGELKDKINTGGLVYKHLLHQHPIVISLQKEIALFKSYIQKSQQDIQSLQLAIDSDNNNLDNTDNAKIKSEHIKDDPVVLINHYKRQIHHQH